MAISSITKLNPRPSKGAGIRMFQILNQSTRRIRRARILELETRPNAEPDAQDHTSKDLTWDASSRPRQLDHALVLRRPHSITPQPPLATTRSFDAPQVPTLPSPHLSPRTQTHQPSYSPRLGHVDPNLMNSSPPAQVNSPHTTNMTIQDHHRKRSVTNFPSQQPSQKPTGPTHPSSTHQVLAIDQAP
ncbi:hypothetical protein M758_1G150500 [Ceratodon purpureus]|nr:hypothetical protein M758_1G150500 [Ceratodon purpureus]